MERSLRGLRPLGTFAMAAALAFVSGSAAAQAVPSPMNLSRSPLFLNASVDPNVAVTLDDSGSMAEAYVPDTADDGCAWRHPRFYSPVGNGLYYNPAVRYSPPLGPLGVPFPDASFTAAWYDGYENTAAGIPGDNRQGSRVVDLGTQYFPERGMFANQNSTGGFTGTRIGHDPRVRPVAPSLTVVTNLGTTDAWYTNCTNPANASVPPPVPPVTGGGSVAISTNNAWLPFTSKNNQAALPFASGTTGFTSSAFYYHFTGDPAVPAQVNNARLYEAVNVSTLTAAERTNFANWYSYYRTRYLAARTALTRVFGVQDQGLRVAYQNLVANAFNPGSTTLDKFVGTPRTAFFNLIYRSNSNVATPNKSAMIRAGRLFATGSPALTDNRNPYWEGAPLSRELTCRQNYHVHVTDGYTNEASNPALTPTARPTLGMTLPDGRAFTTGQPESSIVWNIATPPATSGCPGATLCNPSLARIAFAYWATDLRPDLANNVPPYFPDRSTGITGTAVTGPIPNPADVPEIYWNPANDPATWQHMVNYTVGLGVAGVRAFPGDFVNLRRGLVQWPGLRNAQPEAVDDFWQAGVISRGGYYSAANPQELVDSLSAALTSVVARRGTASAATVTSGIVQASTLAFRTGFDSGDWSGQVNAYRVGTDGRVIEPPVWEAGATLTARTPDSRIIITSANATGGGVPFRWSSLPAAYQASLNDNPVTSIIDSDGLGERRVDYIRGARDFEINNGGAFRIRSSLLGAVINSGAVVVAAPSASYGRRSFPGGPEASAAQTYAQFRTANRNRQRVIYVGANDGMLHAFNAGTGVTGFDAGGNPITNFGNGEELWAYVPREVVPTLSRMTNPNFEFTPYVDNSPVVRDVFIAGRWRTLLVGSLRRGGQGIFALDVTNPNVTEANADLAVLWEFSDDVAGKERMGFSYGRPNISRLANGRWVVVVPASYNSEQDTASEPQAAPADPAVPTGGSTLFVLDAQTGAEIRRFEFAPSVSRGLTTPIMGDYESDFIDEFAVAGDLQGNLWRFDLSDPSPSNWAVDRMYRPEVVDEFRQPITSAPRLFPDSATGGIIAVFSTGKYLEPGDRSVTGVPTQSFYGVRDYGRASGNYPISTSQLQLQTLTKTVNLPPAVSTFTVTNNAIAATQRGWRINFVDLGERGVTSAGALFTQGIAIFSTIIPNGDDPCLPGLRGNVYVIDASTGGAPSFDRNGDGVVTAADLAGKIGEAVSQSVAEGSPALLVNVGGGIGTLVDFPEIQVPTPIWRRRSWREFRPAD
jgi:type IV pilus assembly protein PilY1